MSESKRDSRERAFTEHDQRALEIAKWVREHGGSRILVNPYAPKVDPRALTDLISVIEGEVALVDEKNGHILREIVRYLKSYDFTCIDEAGYDTNGFCLALSEVDTALRHLRRGPRRAIRYLIYRYNLKQFANNHYLFDFVPVLHMEMAAPCNLLCQMCYQTDMGLQEDIKKMSHKQMQWDLFTKVIDEASDRGCNAVVFAGRGEPTLNPRFVEMIQYCHEKGILDIKFNTNVMKFDEAKARKILSLDAFLTIVFSVDAGDKKIFEEIRIGSDFDLIVENIKLFNKIRREEFPDSPVRTRVNMVLFREDQDAEAARALWGPLVDEFSARNANFEQAGSIYQIENGDVSPGKICRVLTTRLYVYADGAVNPCESDYRCKLMAGNAYQDSLYDIWNGAKMTAYRSAHMRGEKNSIYPCNNCTGY